MGVSILTCTLKGQVDQIYVSTAHQIQLLHVIKHSDFSSNLSLVCFLKSAVYAGTKSPKTVFSCQTELFPPPPPLPPPPSDAPPLCPGELLSEESALPPPPPAQESFPHPVTPGQQPVYNPEVCRLILQCHYNK